MTEADSTVLKRVSEVLVVAKGLANYTDKPCKFKRVGFSSSI